MEAKLRIIEALTRTDGSMARNDTLSFIKCVDILHKYVINDCQPKAEPPGQTPEPPETVAEVTVTRRRRKSR